jgi:hypothetical protein
VCKPDDDAQKEARKTERLRAQRIEQGMGSIDDAFEGFNDDYYSKQASAYVDNYNPQLDHHRLTGNEPAMSSRNGKS